MTYQEALDYLYSLKQYAAKPALDRIDALLTEMGMPQNKLKFIHVTGTNGKGSAVVMAASVLTEAGYRTGTFLSPHLERFNERISINGENISDGAFIQLTIQTRQYLHALTQKGGTHPTFFETLCAMAFKYWADQACDIVVLEVGMGGLTDATNVIEAPLVSMITAISLDHTRLLGANTVEIARQKCGIIKQGSVMVDYVHQDPHARQEIIDTCERLHIPYITPEESQLVINSQDRNGSHFIYRDQPITLTMPGAHQPYNAIGVMEAMWALNRSGYSISAEAIANGLERAKIPGRLEKLRASDPPVLIDAAHNPAAIDTLCAFIDSQIDEPIVTVMGMLADKDYQPCIEKIAKRSSVFIATTPDSPRALSSDIVAAIAKEAKIEIYDVPQIEAAVDQAIKIARCTASLVLVCGSIHLIGHARGHVLAPCATEEVPC